MHGADQHRAQDDPEPDRREAEDEPHAGPDDRAAAGYRSEMVTEYDDLVGGNVIHAVVNLDRGCHV